MMQLGAIVPPLNGPLPLRGPAAGAFDAHRSGREPVGARRPAQTADAVQVCTVQVRTAA